MNFIQIVELLGSFYGNRVLNSLRGLDLYMMHLEVPNAEILWSMDIDHMIYLAHC